MGPPINLGIRPVRTNNHTGVLLLPTRQGTRLQMESLQGRTLQADGGGFHPRQRRRPPAPKSRYPRVRRPVNKSVGKQHFQGSREDLRQKDLQRFLYEGLSNHKS